MSTGAVTLPSEPAPATAPSPVDAARRRLAVAHERLRQAEAEVAEAHRAVAALRPAPPEHPPEPPRPADLFDQELARTAPAPRRDPPPLAAADWPTCADPNRLLARVAGTVSERKLRLVTVAAARLVWDLVTPEMREAVETAERLADGEATAEEVQWYRDRLSPYLHPHGPPAARRWGLAGADRAAFFLVFAATYRGHMVRRLPQGGAWTYGAAAYAAQVAPLVRCVLGDPFRPATFDPQWLTADVRGLAAAAYEGRAFDRLPILADALADAGCEDEAILGHCRGGGPHARGCWVVDLALGRE